MTYRCLFSDKFNRNSITKYILFFSFLLLGSGVILGQGLARIDKERAKSMLKLIKSDIKSNYYDANLNGFDLDGRFKLAEDKIDQALTLGHSYSIIAQALKDMDETISFYSPRKNFSIDFGVYIRMIGDSCYIMAVKPGSDAESKGAKPGDEVVAIDGNRITRKNFYNVIYYYRLLISKNTIRVLVQRSGEQELRPFDITGEVIQRKPLLQIQDLLNYYEKEDFYIKFQPYRHRMIGNTAILTLPGFFITPSEIDSAMKNVLKSSNNLVLDLRGTIGSLFARFDKPDKLEKITSYLFDKPLKIAEFKGRKESKPIQSKLSGDNVFKGKLVVLVDSETPPEGQVLARLVQLEKRGIVIGDRTRGHVMQWRYFDHQLGNESVFFFGVEIPVASVLMPDGSTLRETGVAPDEILLPTNTDLASESDPVLARGLEHLGVKMPASEAGKLFPVEWVKR